jgi:ankyrin repeat protein
VKLVAAEPSLATLADDDDQLPLHAACFGEAPLKVVDALLAAYPGAAAVRDSHGKLPTELAAERKAPPEVIAALRLAADAEAGWTPLHRALGEKDSAASVLALLALCPGDASILEKMYGHLPLHVAAANNAPVEVLVALLAAYPAGAAAPDKDNQLPMLRIVARSTEDLAAFAAEVVRLRVARAWHEVVKVGPHM